MFCCTEEFKEILNQNGLKATRQRLLVLEALSSYKGRHFTAEEIHEEVRKAYPEIGLATVYRTIQSLSEIRLIDRINLGDGLARYEIGHYESRTGKHYHHHLICLGCGKVFPFEDDLMEQLENKIKDKTGFKVVDHEVKFYGYCNECGGNVIEEK